jgi:hypothetical protein
VFLYCVYGTLFATLPQLVGWARPVSGGLNLGFYPIKCALRLGYYFQTWGTVLLPLLLLLSFACVEAVRKKMRGEMLLRGGGDYLNSVLQCAVVVSFLMYPSVVESLLSGEPLPSQGHKEGGGAFFCTVLAWSVLQKLHCSFTVPVFPCVCLLVCTCFINHVCCTSWA